MRPDCLGCGKSATWLALIPTVTRRSSEGIVVPTLPGSGSGAYGPRVWSEEALCSSCLPTDCDWPVHRLATGSSKAVRLKPDSGWRSANS